RSARRGAVRLLRTWRTEVRRVVGRRRDRAGADHRQSGGRAGRHAIPYPRPGGARLGRPAAARGRAVPGAVVGHQRGGRGTAGARAGTGQADRDDPVRHRFPLSFDPLRSGMANREGAGAAYRV
ncbi:hypothetical protein LTR94_032773, partial [Friedmanniomyces endolithicus]